MLYSPKAQGNEGPENVYNTEGEYLKNRVLAVVLAANILLSGCGAEVTAENMRESGMEEAGTALIVPLDFSGSEKTYKIMAQSFSEKAAEVPLEILKKETEQICELMRRYVNFLAGIR